jgi:hypothetical protein
MTFHAIIVSLIATALLMCSLSLVGDAVVYFRHLHRRLHRTQRQVAAADYPHPIPNQYPVERPATAPAISRSAAARRQWRLSGGSMSQMREVLGREARRASAAR